MFIVKNLVSKNNMNTSSENIVGTNESDAQLDKKDNGENSNGVEMKNNA